MARLSDVVNEARRRVSEGTNFVRYPAQVVSQGVRRFLQQVYENAAIPGGEKAKQIETPNRESLPGSTEETLFHQATGVASREAVLSTNGTAVSEIVYTKPSPQGLALSDSLLPPGTSLKSLRNHYTIGTCIETGIRTRLYQATTRSDEPVLIKEYPLLERDLNPEEIEVRQKAFERLIELNLKIGNGPDFRVVKLVDAIAHSKERCCYLITKPINHNTTLEAYLEKHGAMPAKQIREVLRQVLETLRYLHTAYRVHFPSGDSERGLPHGNLSLNSLLIRHVEGITSDRQFFIYVSDLELWEHLFHPRTSPRFHPKVANIARNLGADKQDLAALGWVGFLLAGGTLDDTGLSQPFELQSEQPWQALNDEPLRGFLQNLWGPEPRFRTAEQALHALIQLDQPRMASAEQLPEASDIHLARRGLLALMLGVLALGCLGLLSWFVWRELIGTGQSPEPTVKVPFPVTRINAVENAPSIINYWVEPGGAWDFALQRTFTPAGLNPSRQTLMTALHDRCRGRCGSLKLIQKSLPDLNFSRQDEDRSFLFSKLLLGNAQVGLARLSNDIPKGLGTRAVAYDALAVIVPFIDPYRAQNTVGALGRSITLEELRQLYTDTETPEDQLKLHGHRVKLFFPETRETIQLFETLVLQNSDQIDKFWQLKQRAENRDRTFLKEEKTKKNKDINPNIYEIMLTDFENSNGEVIGIGFDRLSRAFNQCSVYPLAIQQGIQTVPTLVQPNGESIDENTDLCGAKGSYFPNVENYPLKYELGVVFSQENANAGQKLAEILLTTEGQYLMSQVGLIPKQPMQNLLNAVEGESR